MSWRAGCTPAIGSWRALLLLGAVALTAACDDDLVGPEGPEGPAVAGTVTASATGDPVAGARVAIGSATATTGTDGRFELTGLTPGPATLEATAIGFEDSEIPVTISSSRLTRNVSLTRIERFEFGDFALYVPATASQARGVLLALGGPDTRGFATGSPFGAPVPQVEAALQALGEAFRTLAAEHELAVLGTSRAGLPNSASEDVRLLEAVREGATRSGRPELEGAPLLLYGMSGGGPEASGFAARRPELAAGLFLKVPAGLESLANGAGALRVPTYVVLAELDAFVDNSALRAGFTASRGAGGLWALALEPGVPHHSVTPAHRDLTIHWMNEVLTLRLGTTASEPLRDLVESAGWIGVHSTRRVEPWSGDADRMDSSWLPSRATAEEWASFGGAGPLHPMSLFIEPEALSVPMGSVENLNATVLTESGHVISDPVVRFTSGDEDVVTVAHDQLCLPGCRNWVYVIPVSPGETTVVAEYEGVSDTARVTVVP